MTAEELHRLQNPSTPRIYDISDDAWRDVTQADVDRMVELLTKYRDAEASPYGEYQSFGIGPKLPPLDDASWIDLNAMLEARRNRASAVPIDAAQNDH